MTRIKVAIHQPNFFPWLGYFDKISRSDVFIFLDHVQYQKTGGLWSNRVQLLIGGTAQWITAPLDRGFHGVRPVNAMKFLAQHPWRQKFVKTLAANYAKALFFGEILRFIEPLIMNSEENIARYNATAILAICEKLDLPTSKIKWSSQSDCEGQSNEMLISLIRAVGGNTYMCGGGAAGYQEEALFSAAEVDLMHQSFKHPVYDQCIQSDFVPGLSIIDALMNCGFLGAKSMLLGNIKAHDEFR